MLAIIHNDPYRNIELFTLVVQRPGEPDEYILFRREANLKALFPDAQWAGQAQPGCFQTYTKSFITEKELKAFGQKVYETVFPEEL